MTAQGNMNFAILLLWAELGPVVFSPGGKFQLEQSTDSLGQHSHGIIETLGPNRTKFYPLPQSTFDEYSRLRPKDLRRNPITRNQYERQEEIGPYQVEGNRIWFGNNYYDEEGLRGVGAFGYFDASTRQYTLFSPPEVAAYEISAILVTPETVWLGLDEFVEDISKVPGGLVRWNRRTHEVQKYPLEFVIDRIRIQGDSLRLETRAGHALFRNSEIRRFAANGRPIAKFPPPPPVTNSGGTGHSLQ